MQEHEKYMRRCFDLALLGRGNVSPNPKVGAVIVYQDNIIGEGYHQKYGQSHAEVNAIASVKDKSLLKKSTIYVNLEPCCHWGKTPPCANLIIESGIKKCVIANKDINPKVFGGGIKLLQDNGVEVVTGVLEKEGWFLNRRFFTNQKEKRPYVIIKYAQSLDGFIAPETNGGWISNDIMKVWVHKQRGEEDAIMVGYNTVLKDNPQLNTRHYQARNPKRIVYDRNLSLPQESNIFDQIQETIIFNHVKDLVEGNNKYIKIDEELPFVSQILEKLYEEKICSIVLEGGAKIINKFLESGLWDEANVIIGQKIFEKGVKAPYISGDFKENKIGDNILRFYYNQK
ncbi:MAG: bifunctional diaminohydroxyphosphoribosylaminopyrimidine deaminase/5-amino-6-(5-phosphoribosylamino)uracil reductase RibD [Bacteroidales bacterium]|nr:bifunctional diaminohydroxyphosphoribosylaminopyrimidine deaminase/5-amino-6-(5-phosphoribosylamino)uracil reductase RibD [Bacteroidales bacterium]